MLIDEDLEFAATCAKLNAVKKKRFGTEHSVNSCWSKREGLHPVHGQPRTSPAAPESTTEMFGCRSIQETNCCMHWKLASFVT